MAPLCAYPIFSVSLSYVHSNAHNPCQRKKGGVIIEQLKFQRKFFSEIYYKNIKGPATDLLKSA